MKLSRIGRAAVPLLAGAVLLAGCGTNRTESAGSGSNCDTSKGTLVVGLIAPLSGGLSAIGLGVRNSADLAVKQANRKCAVPGYRLAFEPEDDQSTPQVAGQAAAQLASDPTVMAVIGTYNSSTAQTTIPILAQQHIAQVSPGNTSPSLSRGDNATTAPTRPSPNYFRLCTTDLVQGPFGAQFLVKNAGKKRIAVIDDGKTYGVGLADQFIAEATRLGATVVDRERVGEKDTDFSSVIAKVRPHRPDAVYYGGEYPVAGPLSKQLGEAGLNIPLMGGDGIEDPHFVALGGREGDFATSVGAPLGSLPSASKFVTDYTAANYPQGPGSFGALSYDSTNVVIAALAKVVATGPFNAGSRQQVIDAIGQTHTSGITGNVAFDQFGDTTNKLLTVYTVKGSDFVPLHTGTLGQTS